MPTVTDRLHGGHVRLEPLLQLLNNQLPMRIEATAPNIALLVDALCHLTRFPDVAHHVREDRIVESLLAKDAFSISFGREIKVQHGTLSSQGYELIQDLASASRDANMSRELVELHLLLYAERLRRNMALEELTLFPAAARHLEDHDWREIELYKLRREPDSGPLIDGHMHGHFAQLHRVIAVEADCRCGNEPGGAR
jgi:hemerythrin-like domain-containing protein